MVNFWATWCAPCREEMPALDALQEGRPREDFEVVPSPRAATAPRRSSAFFDEAGIADLRDLASIPGAGSPAAMGVPGLPVTVILDREGDEIARLHRRRRLERTERARHHGGPAGALRRNSVLRW